MRPTGLLKYAMRALTERKLRAVLTILGIVIGPATIVSLVGATQGYSNASTAQFSTLGRRLSSSRPSGGGLLSPPRTSTPSSHTRASPLSSPTSS